MQYKLKALVAILFALVLMVWWVAFGKYQFPSVYVYSKFSPELSQLYELCRNISVNDSYSSITENLGGYSVSEIKNKKRLIAFSLPEFSADVCFVELSEGNDPIIVKSVFSPD